MGEGREGGRETEGECGRRDRGSVKGKGEQDERKK